MIVSEIMSENNIRNQLISEILKIKKLKYLIT
jgi:hypothetical protein